MKTTNFNHWKITNNCSGRILRIQELKKQIGANVDPSVFIYKNTKKQVISEMKKVFGKKLNEIPKAFIHNGCIWKAVIFHHKHKNRVTEKFSFIPVFNY
jgi:hypothetical protein